MRDHQGQSPESLHVLNNPAQEADKADLKKNIIEIRKLMASLDSFNYKVQIGNPDLGEEIRQGSFVAANKAGELSELLRQILNLIERNNDY